MMAAMGQHAPEVKARLEVNPRHPLIKKLAAMKGAQDELAGKVARQLTDNALLAAGLNVNASEVTDGMTELLQELLEHEG